MGPRSLQYLRARNKAVARYENRKNKLFKKAQKLKFKAQKIKKKQDRLQHNFACSKRKHKYAQVELNRCRSKLFTDKLHRDARRKEILQQTATDRCYCQTRGLYQSTESKENWNQSNHDILHRSSDSQETICESLKKEKLCQTAQDTKKLCKDNEGKKDEIAEVKKRFRQLARAKIKSKQYSEEIHEQVNGSFNYKNSSLNYCKQSNTDILRNRYSTIFKRLYCRPGSCLAKKGDIFLKKFKYTPNSRSAKKTINFFSTNHCSSRNSNSLCNKRVCPKKTCSPKNSVKMVNKLVCTKESCSYKKSGKFFNKFWCTPKSCLAKKGANFFKCTPDSPKKTNTRNIFKKLICTRNSCSANKGTNLLKKLVCKPDSCFAKKGIDFCKPSTYTTCTPKIPRNKFEKILCNLDYLPEPKLPGLTVAKWNGDICSQLQMTPANLLTQSCCPTRSNIAEKLTFKNISKIGVTVLVCCSVWMPCILYVLIILKCLFCSRRNN